MTDALLVMTTIEKTEDAERLAQVLVEGELAACVQILPPITSVYRWQGRTERATESLILIKTTQSVYPVLETVIKSHHPYQIPEIVALPITNGSVDYLDWLMNNVKTAPLEPICQAPSEIC
jgi:periplasmic divalent cation tolerance protein